MIKKILYIDMDGVIVDFVSAFPKVSKETLKEYVNDKDEIPNIFSLMEPMPDAIESVKFLAEHFDVYILSTAPWDNPSAWTDKLNWIKKHLPEIGYKRLILSHNKHLNQGDYLIDDRTANGAGEFKGEHLHFGTPGLENWRETVFHLLLKEHFHIEKLKEPKWLVDKWNGLFESDCKLRCRNPYPSKIS